MSQTIWKRRAALAGLLLFSFVAGPAPFVRAQEMSRNTAGDTATDAQLVERLAAPDYKTADAAVDEIVSRGERMIPLLMKLKGDGRYFRGSLARNPESSTRVAQPSGDSKVNRWLLKQGKLVTVEVAALYLVTAIYYGTLEIAQSPYLTDLSRPDVERRQANTKDVIKKAWKSADGWHRRLAVSGLAKLKAAEDHPLKAADIRFW